MLKQREIGYQKDNAMNNSPDRIELHVTNRHLRRPAQLYLYQVLFLCIALAGCQTSLQGETLEPATLFATTVVLTTPRVTSTVTDVTAPAVNAAKPTPIPATITPIPLPATFSPTTDALTVEATATATPTVSFITGGFLVYGVIIDQIEYIYALQPGHTSRFLLSGRLLSGHPHSPDGTSLIIDTNNWSNPPLSPDKVFILDLETEEMLPLNLLAHPRSGVFWSADGNSLLYVDKYSDDTNDQLIVYDIASGKNQVLLTMESILFTDGWSVDGETIAFVAQIDGQYDLFTVNSNTLEVEQLSDTTDVETLVLWSPTSSRLLVGVTPDNEHVFEMWPWGMETLYLVDIAHNDWELLADTFLTSVSISWSPDGEQIAFSDAGLLCLKNIETMSEICPLANIAPYNEYFASFSEPPVWSADSSWLAFRAYNGRCNMVYFLELETNIVTPGDLGCDISLISPLSQIYWLPGHLPMAP